jgi:D-glycero-alpha-D-manno-heptose-7-phosphate kinase
VIEVSAPVRICDNGGWTDTWFGGPGRILNIAVRPGAEVSIRPADGPHLVLLNAQNFGERYQVVPGVPRLARHPLLEAAIDAFPPPVGMQVEIVVSSAIPAGCGTGTSAAVAVAMLGALGALHPEELSPHDVAYAAHRLEVDILGMESGIQDQLCSALGGINYIEIERYPAATVHSMPMWEELGSLLTLVFCGRPHQSSDVHRQVIEGVRRLGSDMFTGLRDAAVAARDAVLSGDLEAFGQAMIANTEAQHSLHPKLVGPEAAQVMEIAQQQGAIGWKVNGSGGDGGSVTILSPNQGVKEAVELHVTVSGGDQRVLPIQLSPVGLQVHRSETFRRDVCEH